MTDKKQMGFDWQAGQERKDAGLDQVEEHNPSFVDVMRERAREVATQVGTVSTDELRLYARQMGLTPNHQNAWGAIFRGKDWKQVGRKNSSFTTNHSREIRVWALTGIDE